MNEHSHKRTKKENYMRIDIFKKMKTTKTDNIMQAITITKKKNRKTTFDELKMFVQFSIYSAAVVAVGRFV